jgi:hypothetical protein
MKILNKLDKKMLENCSDSDFKRIRKKLKEAKKDINNGRKRSFYLAEYIPNKYVVEFVSIQNQYFKQKFKEEKRKSTDFLFNEDKAIEYGFYPEEYEQKVHKEVSDYVSSLKCPEGEDLNKFRRKQIKSELKKRIPEQTPEQIAEWAEQAYPNINDELWELEVEEYLVSLAIV